MKKLFLILASIVIFGCDFIKDSSVQNPPDILWTKTFGAGRGKSVQQSIDGGYIIISSQENSGSSDIWLIKTDPDGNEEWDLILNGFCANFGNLVQQTFDGGYIILGNTNSGWPDNDYVWLTKLDPDGYGEWSRSYSGETDLVGNSVQQTTDGGYIIVGNTEVSWIDDEDIWLTKTDPDGNEEWNRILGGEYDDVGYSVQQTIDGGYIITGTYGYDIWLIKTDPDGNQEWDRTYGENGSDVGYSVQQTIDGGYIITGTYGYDIWLIKTDPDGNQEWDRTYGENGSDVGYSVQQTIDGGYIITGTYGYDIWLIKTDPDGNQEWDRTYGENGSDIGYSVQQTTDDGYIITGSTSSFGVGSKDVWMIKTDPDGNEEWNRSFGGEYEDVGYSGKQTMDGGYIITGTYGGDIWLMRLASETSREDDGNASPVQNHTNPLSP